MQVKLYRNLATQYRSTDTRPGYVTWTTLYAGGPQRGLAYRHADGVVLKDAKFEVSEAMRQKTIRMRAAGRTKKTPHAFVVGEPVKWWAEKSLARTLGPVDLMKNARNMVRIGYDPYTTRTFIREDCRIPVFESPLVIATPTGVYAQLAACSGRLKGLMGLGDDVEFSQDPFTGDWA